MKIAVISDIHGNLPALICVLEDMVKRKVDKIWCLGDIIGYGANPWECWRILIDELNVATVKGNHEKALIDQGKFDDMNDLAKAGVAFARKTAPDGVLAKVEALPRILEFPEYGVALAHGSFSGNPYDYIVSESRALREFAFVNQPINFVGHTHMPFCVDTGGGAAKKIGKRRLPLDPDERYLINPGSVGQPRDSDSDAAYGILDVGSDRKHFIWLRVEYSILDAATRITNAGLPQHLSERLFKGK